ncbi:MAG: hypothetical protein SPL40_06610, partial [Erysipelotrichaceae bacterium]|nr:hypothetical protein [Erysipelotrichaceae bacterium]
SHLFPSRTQKLSTAGADIAFGKVCTPPGSLEKIYPIFSFLLWNCKCSFTTMTLPVTMGERK